MSRRIAVIVLACIAASTIVAAEVAQAAASSIYRCRDSGGGVLYRAVPCAGGRELDLKVEPADPDAEQRLLRDREVLAAGARARRAAEARELQEQRAQQAQRLLEHQLAMQSRTDAQPPADGSGYGAGDVVLDTYAGGYGYPWPVYNARPARHRSAGSHAGAARRSSSRVIAGPAPGIRSRAR